jgi:hypothetical protein
LRDLDEQAADQGPWDPEHGDDQGVAVGDVCRAVMELRTARRLDVWQEGIVQGETKT